VPDLSFFDHIYTGLDILEQMDFKFLKNKNVGLFCNHTAVNRNNTHLLDLIGKNKTINIKAIFEPEFGIWGVDDKRAKLIGSERIDPVSGAKIFNLLKRSLYPPDWILKELDLIVIDIQDTGSRYSTFIASITKLFESASKHRIPVIILDRPNPIGGVKIEGPLPRTNFQSFEAYHLLPIRHGMTIGEILLMVNEMGWAKDLMRVELSIIPIVNWERNQYLDETSLPWKKPVPYINDINSLIMFSGMDLLRGTNLNVGFGTKSPYLIFGSPWLASSFFKEKLDMLNLPGVSFEEIEYRPKGSMYYNRVAKYNGRSCSGIKINVIDKNLVKPLETATSIITLIERLHPREFQWAAHGYIDKLFGSNQLRLFVAQKKPPSYLSPQYMHDEIEFSKFRNKFLLY
jgi:uncharacterized protein YbbC (DUF1343 family)|tara:strand:- start:425 stop:1627 length:1203 start_codon:yes stop_codon:yes gene_type:complete